MRKSLADQIEQYLKVLIERSEDKQIEIQRVELAETFCCVPSQVTYVIATRFGYAHGYNTESRRGGRGYVRIAKCPDADNRLDANNALFARLDDLDRSGKLTKRETELIKMVYALLLSQFPHYSRYDKEKLLTAALEAFLRREDGGGT
jgi:transcriptional regulator CtsR